MGTFNNSKILMKEKIGKIFFDISDPNRIIRESHGEVLNSFRPQFIKEKSNLDYLPTEQLMLAILNGDKKMYKERFPHWSFDNQSLFSKSIFGSSEKAERFGHISLTTPCANIIFSQGKANLISLLLKLSNKKIEGIIYEGGFICVDDGGFDFFKRGDVVLKNSDSINYLINQIKQLINSDKIGTIEKTNFELSLLQLKNVSHLEFNDDIVGFNVSLFKKIGVIFKGGSNGVKEVLKRMDFKNELQVTINKLSSIDNDKNNAIYAILDTRKQILEFFIKFNIDTDSLFFNEIPVIPIECREFEPIGHSKSARIASINVLYERIIDRNNRLRKFFELNADDVFVSNEKRMLQEAVDDLVNNGYRRRACCDDCNKIPSILDLIVSDPNEIYRNVFVGIDFSKINSFEDGLIENILSEGNCELVNDLYFSNQKTKLIGCNLSKTGDLSIPDGVISISKSAFKNCEYITSIRIPDSVIEIGDEAFMNCSSIEKIKLPSKLERIRDFLFEGCKNLKSIIIPESVKFFGGCYSFKCDRKAPLFGYCPNLVEVFVNGDNAPIHSIDGMLFRRFNKGEELLFCPYGISGSLLIPNFVSSIGKDSICGCENITKIIIPKSVENINCFFDGCSNLKEIYVDSNNRYYCSLKGILFTKNKEKLLRVPEAIEGLPELPKELSVIDNYSLLNCRRIKKIEFPDSIVEIGKNALKGCTALSFISVPFLGKENLFSYRKIDKETTEVYKLKYIFENVPDSLEEVFVRGGFNIVPYAFEGCNNVKTLRFGKEFLSNSHYCDCIKLIEPNMFWTKSLEQIIVEDNINLYTQDGVLYKKSCEKSTLIIYPRNKIDKVFEVPNNVDCINTGAFFLCSNLESIVMNNNVQNIGSNAFDSCINLKEINLSSNISILPKYCFHQCSSLQAIDLPHGLKVIDSYAFSEMKLLSSIVLPSSLNKICSYIFEDTLNLNRVKYSGNLDKWMTINKIDEWFLRSNVELIECEDEIIHL